MPATLDKSVKTWERQTEAFSEKDIPYLLFLRYLSLKIRFTPSKISLSPYEYSLPWFSQEKTTNVTADIEEVLNHVRNSHIIIPKLLDVRNYLIHYPDMIDLLCFVCEVVSEHFVLDTELSLEVYHDPEIEDEYLTLYVRKQRYDKNIMKEIKEIRSMYENILIDKTGWLLLTTDFQSPRE